jgi:hypothetical protein
MYKYNRNTWAIPTINSLKRGNSSVCELLSNPRLDNTSCNITQNTNFERILKILMCQNPLLERDLNMYRMLSNINLE